MLYYFLRLSSNETGTANSQWRNMTRRYEGVASVNIHVMMQGCSIHQECDLSELHAGGRESTLVYPPLKPSTHS